MWGMFALSVVAGALFLYLPGYLLLRSFNLSRLVSAVCAPLVSVVFYQILVIVYSKMGMFVSWELLVLPLTLLSIIAFIVHIIFYGDEKPIRLGVDNDHDDLLPRGTGPRLVSFDRIGLAYYVVIGIVATVYLFASELPTPAIFTQNFDAVHHLGTLRAFIESGDWSPLHFTLYLGSETRIDPFPAGGFYPSGWHCIAALIVSSLDVPVTLAANATNFIICGIVYPASMYLLVRYLFRERPGVIALAAVCIPLTAGFPWKLLMWGPVYPNIMAFALMPALIVQLIVSIAPSVSRSDRVTAIVMSLVGILCMGFVQPNAAFTAGVFWTPYAVYRVHAVISCRMAEGNRVARRLIPVLVAAGAVAVIAAIWVGLLMAPPLHDVVSYRWRAEMPLRLAFIEVVLMGFGTIGFQPVLAVAALLGIIYTIRHREFLWLSFAYVLACIQFAFAISSNSFMQQLLSGFWYNDAARVAAFAEMFAIPLIALGLYLVVRVVNLVVDKMGRTWHPLPAIIVTSIAFVCLSFIPFTISAHDPRTGDPREYGNALQTELEELHKQYDYAGANNLNVDEQRFIGEVIDAVGPDTLIANDPNDGSAYAYGVFGLHTYYRYWNSAFDETESPQSRLVRDHLVDVSTRPDVRAAVRSIGIEYVLLLDKDNASRKDRYFYPEEHPWLGIETIDDDTPGFEVVLSEGDMRLYRIVTDDRG